MRQASMWNPKLKWLRQIPGPWKGEADKIQWKDEQTGLPCLVVRQEWSGHLCGYVGVSFEHKYYGMSYIEVYDLGNDYDPHVHGGLTFSDECQPFEDGLDEVGMVCHVPDPGEPHEIWWFGFDAGHGGDYMPYYKKRGTAGYGLDLGKNAKYRDVKYMQSNCRDLALWLAEQDKKVA